MAVTYPFAGPYRRYALPAINTRREAILMHLAATELSGQADPSKLARLRRLVGLN